MQIYKSICRAYSKKYSFHEKIVLKVKLFAAEPLTSAYAFLDPSRKNHNFELLGLDNENTFGARRLSRITVTKTGRTICD